MADLEKDELQARRKKEEKAKISLSQYKEPELMPMREKQVLSRKEQKAKKMLTSDSKRYGINLDIGDNPMYNYGKVINPSVADKKPDNLTESARNINSNDPAIAAKGFLGIKGKAPQAKVPELDSKQEMDDAILQRKAKIKDTIAAFFTGYGGNKYDWENSQSSKIQRDRDERFQEYKDIVQNNQKVKEVWDSKNREDLINFLKTEKKTRDLNEKEQAKLEEAKFIKDRDFALKSETEQAKIKGGYYNRSKSTAKSTTPKINLPFESENVINEMNLMTGGASAAKSSRNQQRLSDLVSANPKALETLSDLSEKAATIRSQIDKQDKLRLKSLKDGLSAEAEGYAAEIAKMNKELTQYQNDIKSILNGKTPEAKQETAPETTKTQQPKKISAKEYIDSL